MKQFDINNFLKKYPSLKEKIGWYDRETNPYYKEVYCVNFAMLDEVEKHTVDKQKVREAFNSLINRMGQEHRNIWGLQDDKNICSVTKIELQGVDNGLNNALKLIRMFEEKLGLEGE